MEDEGFNNYSNIAGFHPSFDLPDKYISKLTPVEDYVIGVYMTLMSKLPTTLARKNSVQLFWKFLHTF
jgi:hypothetical protein